MEERDFRKRQLSAVTSTSASHQILPDIRDGGCALNGNRSRHVTCELGIEYGPQLEQSLCMLKWLLRDPEWTFVADWDVSWSLQVFHRLRHCTRIDSS